ncbi:RNA-directed DNA polymerase [Abeliophyllum distichum]|uniref:RNA-directed DNA polymerase n=1 Tax=Abeliophyllum distichum TaxID=126358 RepID=A0ABD1QEF6_9LAMI
MPFDLKNAACSQNRLGHIMEVYVDDMLVKSVNAEDHIGHLREMFEILQKAVSSVLIYEDGPVQLFVYYVSKALQDAETRYSNMEKLILSLIIACRKLRQCFQSHSIDVLMNLPLRQIFQKPDTLRKLMKWLIELRQFEISYKLRPSMKG